MNLTTAAANKITDIIIDENNPKIKGLRVSVAGGGCNGFEYVFNFEEEITEDDFTFESNQFKLIIDNISMNYLNEATLDYVEKQFESKFVINNPKVKTSCGCGASIGF
jgi:iron-sulfur cluster insertion protein